MKRVPGGGRHWGNDLKFINSHNLCWLESQLFQITWVLLYFKVVQSNWWNRNQLQAVHIGNWRIKQCIKMNSIDISVCCKYINTVQTRHLSVLYLPRWWNTNLEHNFFRETEILWSNLDVGGEVWRDVSSVNVAALGNIGEVTIVRITRRIREHCWNCLEKKISMSTKCWKQS